MKQLSYALAALCLLVLPIAAAEPAPATQRNSVIQTDGGMHVTEQLDWQFTDNASYEPVARFQAPPAIANLAITLWQGARSSSVPGDAVQRSAGTGGLDLYRVDLSDLQPSIAAGARYSVVVEYDQAGTTIRLATTYAAGSLTLFVRTLDGWTAASDRFSEWIPVGHDTHHATLQGVAANETHTVTFTRAAAASTRNLDTYVWGAGGLFVGLIVMMVAIRQGWVASRAKPKFEKAGAAESRALLEARRRTLLAALKELEQAHEAKEVPDDAYAPLKEEYKAQAVRAMRNLEEKREG